MIEVVENTEMEVMIEREEVGVKIEGGMEGLLLFLFHLNNFTISCAWAYLNKMDY